MSRLAPWLRGRFGTASPATAEPYELKPAKHRRQSALFPYRQPDDTYIEVFWKDFGAAEGVDPLLRGGIGPVLSLVVSGHEAMRFDCLGEQGHFHVALVRPRAGSEIRIWFRERTAPEQVERAVFELRRNLDYYLQRNPVEAVRSARIARDEHETRCEEARRAALALWHRNVTPG